MENNSDEKSVDTLPIAPIALALRCCEPVGLLRVNCCGRPARWHRAGDPELPWAAHCEEHRRPGDTRVPPALPVRRVRMSVTIDMAAVLRRRNAGEAEAVIAICHALEALGATVNLLDVQSAMVRNGPPRGPGVAIWRSGHR